MSNSVRRLYVVGAVVSLLTGLLAGCGSGSTTGGSSPGAASGGGSSATIKVAMVPKLIGLAVFKANQTGAENVAKSLNIDFKYTGPVEASAQGQVETFNSLINQKFDVITTTANNETVLAPALVKAMAQGMKVVSYDSDVLPAARNVFVQNTPYPAMGKALVDAIVPITGPKADIAILSSTPDGTIQIAWLKAVNEYLKASYPGLKIVTTQYGKSDPAQSLTAGLNILRSFPSVKGIIAPDGAAIVGAGNAVKQLGLTGKVGVSGTGTPNDTKALIKSGNISASVLWDEVKEGEFVMYMARMVHDGKVPENGTITVGPFGTREVKDKVVVFGDPVAFTKANVDQYDF